MERHVWLRALAVSLAPPRSYRVSARMHRRNGLRAFRLHAIHDAPGHRGCVTNVISWDRNHRWPGIMSSSWSNVVYFPYSPCRVIKLINLNKINNLNKIHLSQPLRSALPPITTTEIPNISCFPSRKKRKIFPSFSSGTEIFRKKFATNETRIQNSPRRWLRIPRALVDSRDRRRPGTRAGISISRRVRIQKWSVGRGYWKEVKNTNVRARSPNPRRDRGTSEFQFTLGANRSELKGDLERYVGLRI